MGELLGRELTALIGVDDLGYPEACERLLDDLAFMAGLQRDGHLVSEHPTAALLLLLFAALLFLLPAVAAATGSLAASAIAVFYNAGALVFGGGHLQQSLQASHVRRPR